jgi:hypothetical protein
LTVGQPSTCHAKKTASYHVEAVIRVNIRLPSQALPHLRVMPRVHDSASCDQSGAESWDDNNKYFPYFTPGVPDMEFGCQVQRQVEESSK